MIEFKKQIKLTGLGVKKVGESISLDSDIEDILIRMGYANKFTMEAPKPINTPINTNPEIKNEEGKKRVRRTKEQIELDNNK